MDDESVERERAQIREAFRLVAVGELKPDPLRHYMETIILAYSENRLNDVQAITDLLADRIGQNEAKALTPILKEAGTARQKTRKRNDGTPKDNLTLLTFGIRALELKRQGIGQSDAISQAHVEIYGSEIELSNIRKSYWKPFVEMIKQRRSVPYFRIDPTTGVLSPTDYVPAELAGNPGRPRGKN